MYLVGGSLVEMIKRSLGIVKGLASKLRNGYRVK
jgi:hypothetical protein